MTRVRGAHPLLGSYPQTPHAPLKDQNITVASAIYKDTFCAFVGCWLAATSSHLTLCTSTKSFQTYIASVFWAHCDDRVLHGCCSSGRLGDNASTCWGVAASTLFCRPSLLANDLWECCPTDSLGCPLSGVVESLLQLQRHKFPVSFWQVGYLKWSCCD